MFARTMMVGVLLICSLWIETTIAGSSFLSPEQPITQRKVPSKPTTKFHRRDAEAFLDVHGSEIERDSNKIEIKFTVPFEIGMKISEEQYKDYGPILEKLLEDILVEDNRESPETQ
ncbi:appetite-regulating hormone isoform X2 [Rhineura floridana]|uniref:appetite-regulating hormone isoform X2 n=1 Tax=Rhineura floridana TaxID=261503 RepID=UPI002AC88FC2|nr:appetite-regulating hormone isoform X2 [Rhineura floridana]